ncbi:Na+/H+ antiporter NhaA [Glaciihabitans arcticus]|uniref:Na(+)/H(+) antiporter NhaA n=1 Tax=Glaciihabitans arcticus TaxID=2668039 RepID=A0A4Q9GQ21_9MICO|nr:Na+/H+ antiporter NhaA [Glaciihabitans arcticus]TBN56801.1 Na+/H+ antiporter NhaA [Glaciihabitans arcticus]
MQLLRSPQFSAIALLVAAALGLAVANSPWAPAAHAIRDSHASIPWLGLDLSLGHWVTDGLLAIFFFLAAVELKHELRHGELNSARKALVPAAAAVGGVIVPAAIFLLLVPQAGLSDGWPIPTATDIAFALGVLALVGRHLPTRVRALLLALAVIDDLIAIVIIAFFFTDDVRPLALLAAVPVILLFGWLSYRVRGPLVVAALIVLAAAAWVLVALGGIHPTIAGVSLGLILASRVGERTRRAIEPWSNAIILPLFAFVATLVTVPNLSVTPLGMVFWAIVIALPVGKIIGITGGALIATSLNKRDAPPIGDLLTVAALGGIGFTVSLLMNELAFAGNAEATTEGTLGVLVGSVIAIVVGGTFAAVRSRSYFRKSRPTSAQ